MRLEKSYPEFEAIPESKRKYQSAVGSLMYVMLGSRPDISYAVGKVSQYSMNPDITHFTAVKRIFRYLAGTRIVASAMEARDLGAALPMPIGELVMTEGQSGVTPFS